MSIKSLMNNKIIKAGGWYTFTDFFVKGLSFLTIPIFTKLLSTAEYGIVAIYSSWVGVFSILISLDLAWSIQKAKLDFPEKFNQYISSILTLSLLLQVVFIGVITVFERKLIEVINLPKYLFYFMLLQAYFAFIQKLTITRFRVEYKYKLVSTIHVTISIFSILFSIFLIKNIFTINKYYGRILGIGVPVIIIGFIYLVYLLYLGREFINLEYWKHALSLSAPFILHDIASIINAQFDRIVINNFVGPSATGIYSFSYSVGMIVSILMSSFYQAFLPYFLEKMKKQEHNIVVRISRIYRNIFTVIYGCILLIMPEVVKLMVNDTFWEGIRIIPLIFMAYYIIFLYTFEINIEYFYQKTTYISIGTIIAAICNIILNILFVPIYGYYAAAITTVISYGILLVYHNIITKVIMKKAILKIRFHFISLGYLIGITIVFYLFENNFPLRLVGVICLVLNGVFLIKKI